MGSNCCLDHPAVAPDHNRISGALVIGDCIGNSLLNPPEIAPGSV